VRAPGRRGSKYTTIARRLPPFGKVLAERQRYLNLPLFAVITTGAGCWDRAREWQSAPNDCPAMVLPGPGPESYVWPVQHAIVTIEVGEGPSNELVLRLARCLFKDGARGVIVVTDDDGRILSREGLANG